MHGKPVTNEEYIRAKDAFEAWWDAQTADSDKWSTLERSVAKEAWFAAIKWEEK